MSLESHYKNLLEESQQTLGLQKEAGMLDKFFDFFRSGAKNPGRYSEVGTVRPLKKPSKVVDEARSNSSKRVVQKGKSTETSADEGITGTAGTGSSNPWALGLGGAGLGAGSYAVGREMGHEEAMEESEKMRNLAFGSGVGLGTAFPTIAKKGYGILKNLGSSSGPSMQQNNRRRQLGRQPQRYRLQ